MTEMNERDLDPSDFSIGHVEILEITRLIISCA